MTAAKKAAVEKSESLEHRCSMLQLDLNNAQEDMRELKQELAASQSKVGRAIRE